MIGGGSIASTSCFMKKNNAPAPTPTPKRKDPNPITIVL